MDLIKYILIGPQLIKVVNMSFYLYKFFPPETIKLEESVFFRDVRTDNFFIYFLVPHKSSIKVFSPETGELKKEISFPFLRYVIKFDVSQEGEFSFLIKKGGNLKLVILNFSPLETLSYFIDKRDIEDILIFNKERIAILCDSSIYIFNGFEKRVIYKGDYENYGKWNSNLFISKGDTLIVFEDIKLKKINIPFKYDFIFPGEKKIFYVFENNVYYKKKWW